MTSKSEPAGVWVRVSSGGQDEANQLPDVERYCAEHGYTIARRYELNDKSASKGEQQDKQDEVIEDLREGSIKILVCWHSDRVERRGPEALFGFIRKIKDAGGRIESTKEPLLGTEDLSGEAVTALNAVFAHQYSVHLAEQVKIGHDRIRANNGLMPGGIPWGYYVVGEKYNKRMIPTDECKAYIPLIFQRCIAGDSCRTIAVWLDGEGVKPKRGDQWNERSVWQIIHNTAYAGRRQDEGDIKPSGKPSRKNRRTIMNVEPVIGMSVWESANDALAKRPGRGPGINGILQPKPMLANLKCARCGSPMYRLRNYYRCFGKGTRRKGCGNMVPFDETNAIVHAWITLISDEPHKTRQWVEGVNFDDQISETKQDMRDAINDENFAVLPELQANLAELRSRESVPGHFEYVESGMTVGAYFHGLDLDGQREYLKTHDIRVEKVPKLDGVPGIRLVIDGEDYGVTRLVIAASA